MSILLYLVVSIIAIIIVHLFMSRLFKDDEKKDKGFILFYHRLTYRRRIIRSLWNIPIMILAYLAIYSFGNLSINENIFIGIIFLLIAAVEFTYNYIKWRNVESHKAG